MRNFAALVLGMGLWFGGVLSAQAEPRSFVMFFQSWSAAIDDPAQAVVKEAAAWAVSHPGDPMRVVGFADTTGSKDANILLSELRAQVVTDALEDAGVPPTRVKKVGRGSVQFAGSSLEARRVEIRIGR